MITQDIKNHNDNMYAYYDNKIHTSKQNNSPPHKIKRYEFLREMYREGTWYSQLMLRFDTK